VTHTAAASAASDAVERMTKVKEFLIGAVAGVVVVWRWRDNIQRYLDEGLIRVADAMDVAQQKADELIDKAKARANPRRRSVIVAGSRAEG
jgi:hypothetical protein